MSKQPHVRRELAITLPDGSEGTAFVTCAPVLAAETLDALREAAEAVAQAHWPTAPCSCSPTHLCPAALGLQATARRLSCRDDGAEQVREAYALLIAHRRRAALGTGIGQGAAPEARQGRSQAARAVSSICRAGHAISGANAYRRRDGREECAECKRARQRRRRGKA